MNAVQFKAFSQGRLGTFSVPAGKVANSLIKNGITVSKDDGLLWPNEPQGCIGTTNQYNATHLYTATNKDKINHDDSLFLGLSGPLPGYFTVDTIGSWPYITPTYTNIDLDLVDLDKYPHELINMIKEQKQTLYTSALVNKGKASPEPKNLPDNHILIIVSHVENEWMDGWAMFGKLISMLSRSEKYNSTKYPVVIKFDPRLFLDHQAELDKKKLESHQPMLDHLDKLGFKYYYGAESLHDILPKSRIVIQDEGAQFLEPVIYEVPMLTYGAPPYHQVIKRVLHQHEILPAINNIDWHDPLAMRKWLTWYLNDYVCHSQESCDRRVEEILSTRRR